MRPSISVLVSIILMSCRTGGHLGWESGCFALDWCFCHASPHVSMFPSPSCLIVKCPANLKYGASNFGREIFGSGALSVDFRALPTLDVVKIRSGKFGRDAIWA